jgi:hypothetical protein
MLLTEEMRHVIQFLDWKAKWWLQESSGRTEEQADIAEGITAYAWKEACVMRTLAKSFSEQWFPTLMKHGLSVAWPVNYIPTGAPLTTTEIDNIVSDGWDEELAVDFDNDFM